MQQDDAATTARARGRAEGPPREQASLRRGDLVEVRGPAEILATLDERGALDAMPFMPEMVAWCGRRLVVERRADKVCDTIDYGGSRRVPDTVLLDDVRCDGSGHDGCQAECRFYWKEAWLRPVTPGTPETTRDDDGAARDALARRVAVNTRTVADDGGVQYRCQATELLAASTPLALTDPRPYLREVTTRNVSVRTFGRVMARATVTEGRRKLGRLPNPPLAGESTRSPATEPLDLRPGEWVRVRSAEEIRATLTDKGKNRGLWFDAEMLPFCGQTFQVRARVQRLLDERDGRMIELASDCVTLEGAVCSGERSTQRWFCPRALYPYWRECWLERI